MPCSNRADPPFPYTTFFRSHRLLRDARTGIIAPSPRSRGPMDSSRNPGGDLPHVVVIGGGFAGLWATRALARATVRITLVDRGNHHLFQPLLYQVATAGLSAPDIAAPLRHILQWQRNVTVLMETVADIDTRSEEHTSELQSLMRISYAVFCLKKNNNTLK